MNIGDPHPASVLVVEDEPLVRTFLLDVLRQAGFRVIVATNGEDALALTKNKKVSAIVSDVAMPGAIDGVELARRVKSDNPLTGVILVSGISEAAKNHLPRGVRFVTKPVKATTLLRLVREVADPRAPLAQNVRCFMDLRLRRLSPMRPRASLPKAETRSAPTSFGCRMVVPRLP